LGNSVRIQEAVKTVFLMNILFAHTIQVRTQISRWILMKKMKKNEISVASFKMLNSALLAL